MRSLLVACALFSLSAAAVLPEDANAVIDNYENINDGNGNYNFSFDTSNGIHREEIGYLVKVGTPDEHIAVEGLYSYFDTEGKLVSVTYTADENGYRVNPPTPGPVTTLSPSIVASLLGK